MNILHYTLGFPPYRSGGLTEYAIDLAHEQVVQGDTVNMLWPGKITNSKKVRIKKRNNVKGIGNYELINPLPVSLMNGILDIKFFMKQQDKEIYIGFLKSLQPNIIHVHTLMGLPREFLQAAIDLNIRTLYTSHDYFGLCSKVNLLYEGQICKNWDNCEDCYICNQTAFSNNTIRIMQSHLYSIFKNNFIVRFIRKTKKNDIQTRQNNIVRTSIKHESIGRAQEYKHLRNFYIEMFESIDTIHFNSNLTKEIYSRFFTPKQSVVIPILHANIQDNRKIRQYDEKLRLGYLGPISEYKGYYLLIDSIDELFAEGLNKIELNLYTDFDLIRPYVKLHKPYNPSELANVFNDIDLLVVPSLWYETFGFVVTEALSFGVPVVLTDRVGAKDLIKEGFGLIIHPDKQSLKLAIRNIYEKKEVLCDSNRSIVNADINLDFTKHVNEICSLYLDI